MVEKIPKKITVRGSVYTYETDFIDSARMRKYILHLHELDGVKVHFRKSKERENIAYLYVHELKRLKLK